MAGFEDETEMILPYLRLLESFLLQQHTANKSPGSIKQNGLVGDMTSCDSRGHIGSISGDSVLPSQGEVMCGKLN